MLTKSTINVPYFRPSITDAEVNEVVSCLRSGWLTTGPRTTQFESDFKQSVGARHAVALNSGTAALHLAVEALALGPRQVVLVPALTFAATAEVVRYQGAEPLLIDCDSETLNMDLRDAERKITELRSGRTPIDSRCDVVGMIPVHVGGLMLDMSEVSRFAARHGIWVVEDAAHAYPAAFRTIQAPGWRRCGENTSDVTCYSFYANKTITTGEGGMAVTNDERLAERMRCMSLHGISHDAWNRKNGRGGWDYRIIAPGYKYNVTDIAAAIGIHQVQRAEAMRQERQAIAHSYLRSLADVAELDLPIDPDDRIHSWHLFPIRLRLDRLSIDRNQFLSELRERGVGCSVHWRPLHLHPYYQTTFGWAEDHLPVASREWLRLISMPLFPGMRPQETRHVVQTIRDLCQRYAVRQRAASTRGNGHALRRSAKPR